MCVSAQAQAQHNKLLQEYRTKVKAYNQDIKAAGYAASIQQEKEKSAKGCSCRIKVSIAFRLLISLSIIFFCKSIKPLAEFRYAAWF